MYILRPPGTITPQDQLENKSAIHYGNGEFSFVSSSGKIFKFVELGQSKLKLLGAQRFGSHKWGPKSAPHFELDSVQRGSYLQIHW